MTRRLVSALVLSIVIGLLVEPVFAQVPVGSTFTYQGRLTDGGQPYSGSADLIFKLFDAATAGSAIGPPLSIPGYTVTDGLVTVDLDFGAGAFLGDERWLDLTVNGTALTPRQKIRPAPYAMFALNAPVGSGSPWQTAGNDIQYNGGNVGVGPLTPTHRFTVQSSDDKTLRLVGPEALYGHGARLYFGDESNVYLDEDEDDKLYIHTRLRTSLMGGFVGIGTTAPQQRLSVSEGMNIDQLNLNDGTTLAPGLGFGGASGEGIASQRTPGQGQYGLDFYTNYQKRLSLSHSGDLGIGTTAPAAKLEVMGTARAGALEVARGGSAMVEAGATILGGNLRLRNAAGAVDVDLGSGLLGDGVLSVHDDDGSIGVMLDGGALNKGGELTVNDDSGAAKVTIRGGNAATVGRVTTPILEITGGSDLSEQFDITGPSAKIRPGMVVCIDASRPGKLQLCAEAYDHKVAGIISGAGGIRPGMLMGQGGTLASGDHPVALTGRVWTWCDASSGAIEPGDLLTTSGVLGHAMKVDDSSEADGAVLGKAMTALDHGRDLVLVLVSLQ